MNFIIAGILTTIVFIFSIFVFGEVPSFFDSAIMYYVLCVLHKVDSKGGNK